LLDRQADINARVSNHTTLHLASLQGHQHCIDRLTARRADINARDGDGNTPLHVASLQGHRQCIERLTELGADNSIRNVR